jgi:hypothetical protein
MSLPDYHQKGIGDTKKTGVIICGPYEVINIKVTWQQKFPPKLIY